MGVLLVYKVLPMSRVVESFGFKRELYLFNTLCGSLVALEFVMFFADRRSKENGSRYNFMLFPEYHIVAAMSIASLSAADHRCAEPLVEVHARHVPQLQARLAEDAQQLRRLRHGDVLPRVPQVLLPLPLIRVPLRVRAVLARCEGVPQSRHS